MNTSTWFDLFAQVAEQIGVFLPVEAKPITGAIVVALHFISDLAKQGIDPSAHIERLHAADAALRDTEDSWASRLRSKYPG